MIYELTMQRHFVTELPNGKQLVSYANEYWQIDTKTQIGSMPWLGLDEPDDEKLMPQQ